MLTLQLKRHVKSKGQVREGRGRVSLRNRERQKGLHMKQGGLVETLTSHKPRLLNCSVEEEEVQQQEPYVLFWLELLICWCVNFDAERGQSEENVDGEEAELANREREVGRAQRGRKRSTPRGRGSKGTVTGKGKATRIILLLLVRVTNLLVCNFRCRKGAIREKCRQ